MSREDEYIPIELWIRQDQMDKISKDVYNQNTTIYSFIRKIIDFYYNHKNEV